jgi:acyl-CoA thioesterase
MITHPLDTAIALDTAPDGTFRGETHPAWANMVGPYGGITAATLLNAACLHPARIGEPLALTVNYAGPVADGAFRIAARAARTNRTTQHWTLALEQAGELATTATALFAVRRETWADQELHAPTVPPADEVPVTPHPAHITWAGRYEMRFVAGAWPDLARPQTPLPADSESLMWVRDLPPRPLDAPALAAISDAFYPRSFRRRQAFTPSGTVSITVHFHADAIALAAQGTRPVLARARAQRFAKGFSDQVVQIWSDTGQLLASSMQTVYAKD